MIPALSLISALGTAGVNSTQQLSTNTISTAKSNNGMSFEDALSQVSSDVVDRLKASEATSISGIHGKASPQNVVEAILSAQQSLQTAIAIRDKVVSAYQSISQMAI